MEERSGLEGVARGWVGQLVRSQAAQFTVNQRQ